MPYANPATPLATSTPPAETTSGRVGNGDDAARGDHTHPRPTSATIQTLDATGETTVMFTRAFTGMPAVACLLYEASDSQPVVFKVRTWIQDAGGNYTGCIIRGFRSSILPALSGILLIGPLISALANFNVFGGSASGAQFCCIALQPSN